MPITLLCPRLTCRAVLSVPDKVRGKRVRCAECGVSFMVPQSGKPTPAARKPAEKEVPR